MRAILLTLIMCTALGAADAALIEKGKAEEKRCAGCHGVKIITTQRLSATGWERELDKMVRWGAEIKEREALMAYLIDTYGDDKPMPKPVVSAGAASATSK
jgi:hypothetical protein